MRRRPCTPFAVHATLLLMTVALAGMAPTAEAAPPPEPDLGAGIDPLAGYDPQDTCSPAAKEGTVLFKDLLLATYPQTRSLGISRACDVGGTSEHKEGRAFDWGARKWVPEEKAAVDEFLAWLLKTDKYGNKHAMARRMGIMYMIWDEKIWGSYRASEGWRTYTGSNPHTDHVHFSLSWDGALAKTTYWTWYKDRPTDARVPDTDATLSGTAGDNGWWRSAVTVKLTATDSGGSGVEWTRYREDGGSWKTYTGPFTHGGQGGHHVQYHSRDKAGNVEPAETVGFQIDTVAPATALGRGGPVHVAGGTTYVTSATPFTLAASDATSGVAATWWTWRGTTKTYGGAAFSLAGSDGAGALQWWSKDQAGNIEAARSGTYHLDNTPPAVGLAHPEDGSTIVALLAPLTIEPTVSDGGSGVARVELWVDGARRATDTASHHAFLWDPRDEAAGTHVLQVRAVDHLGNTRTVTREVWTVPSRVPGALATLDKAQDLANGALMRLLGLGESPTDPAAVEDALHGAIGDVGRELPRLPPNVWVPG